MVALNIAMSAPPSQSAEPGGPQAGGYFTIVKRSVRGSDRWPAAFVAVITSAYRPGLSFLERETRPSNTTVLLPLWPAKDSVPALDVRLHAFRAAFL
jgi:hypothetical protein